MKTDSSTRICILADECIPLSIIRCLRNAGHKVLEVRCICQGCSDRVVLELAQNEGCILLTENTADFANLAVREGLKVPGIIALRMPGISNSRKGEILVEAIGKAGPLREYMSILEPARLRKRKLP